VGNGISRLDRREGRTNPSSTADVQTVASQAVVSATRTGAPRRRRARNPKIENATEGQAALVTGKRKRAAKTVNGVARMPESAVPRLDEPGTKSRTEESLEIRQAKEAKILKAEVEDKGIELNGYQRESPIMLSMRMDYLARHN
jgi:hypothetical protein